MINFNYKIDNLSFNFREDEKKKQCALENTV